MKNTLFPRHTATLLQYVGIGLISGAISHGFFSGSRSVVTALIGIIVFIAGLLYERKGLGQTGDVGRVLLIGIVFSVSTAMVAGGAQHFLDSPWRSAWIIPVGYFISLLVFRTKENMQSSFFDAAGKATLVSIILALILYPLAQITPAYVSVNDHHGGPTRDESRDTSGHHDNNPMREHCEQMPEMQGCEKYTHQSPLMNGGHDHSSMVTSEEAFVVNMIPHHQEAVDTARLVVAKGKNPELKKLAQAIIDAQEKEIAMMNQWKTDWKYSSVTPTYENMMGDGTKLTGKELDNWFLHGMIMHHMGAVQMAQSVLQLSPRKEVSDFARDVIAAQTDEIQQMQEMLGMDRMNTMYH